MEPAKFGIQRGLKKKPMQIQWHSHSMQALIIMQIL